MVSVSKTLKSVEATPTHWLNMLTRKGRILHLKRVQINKKKRRGMPSLKSHAGYRQLAAWMVLRRWAKPEYIRYWTTIRNNDSLYGWRPK
jgi:hypothetical protein